MALIDWTEGLALGFGYDEVRGEPKQRGAIGNAAPAGPAGEIGEFNLVLIQSSEEYDEALDIDAKIGGGFGLFGGSAKFGFKKRCKVSSQATFCTLRTVATHAYEHIADPELSPDAKTLLENNNTKRFRERFGDKFVSGQVAGVEFYGVVRIEAKQVERQLEIAAKVQASYGGIGGEAGTDFKETMQSAEHRIEILTFQKGGEIGVCQTLPDLFARAKAALELSRTGRAYPFAVMLDPYSELKLPNDDVGFIKIEAAQRNLKKLAEHMWALQKLQNDIDFVLRNQPWFEKFNVAQLNEVNRKISAELNTIVDKADICSRDFQQCEAYAPEYPELEMPRRLAGAPEPPAPPEPVVVPQIGAGGRGDYRDRVIQGVAGGVLGPRPGR